MNKISLLFFSGFLLTATLALPAQAHKVVVSAYAEGAIIEGEIGFSGGEVSGGTKVEVLDDDGNKLGDTVTDADGIFQFTPTKSIPHTFRANLGQGHIAVYRLAVDELPEGLDGTTQPTEAAPQTVLETAESFDTSIANKVGVDPVALDTLIRSGVKLELAAFKSQIASAVRKETKPLRKEIAAYKEKNDMQSILGGIGYIFGLFGIGFYLVARRERSKASTSKATEPGSAE